MPRPRATTLLSASHPPFRTDPSQASYPAPRSRCPQFPAPDCLITIHHLSVNDLLEADRLGGLPAPSLGITKLDAPFLGFGEISLIGTRDLADPRHTPVYSCDAGTPSAPRDGRNRKQPAVNLNEATARMLSSAARRRRGPYNLDRLLAETGGRFATPEDLQAARNRVVDPDTARDEREYLGALLDLYVRAAARCHPDQHVSPQARESAAMKALAHSCRNGSTRESLGAALARRRFEAVPLSVLHFGERVMRALRDHVTDYFEAKPRRAVALREFAGAVVPADAPAEVFRILRRTGLRPKRYAKREQARAIQALAIELARHRPDILFRSGACRQPKNFGRREVLSSGTGRLTRLAFDLSRACVLLPPSRLLAPLCGILLRHILGICLVHILAEALASR